MTQANAPTAGVHHVGLTVPDLRAAQTFFEEALAFERVGGIDDYPSVFLSDGSVMLTLWQAENPEQAIPFDRRNNIGLHHLSLLVSETVELDVLHDELGSREDVAIEFPPESLGGGATRHMMCRVPGNIRIEFIAPAAA